MDYTTDYTTGAAQNTSTGSTTLSRCHTLNDPDCIGLIAGSAFGGVIFIVIVVVIIVICYRRRTDRKVPINLPNPEEIDMPAPQNRNDEVYRSKPPNDVRELPAIPTNETEQRSEKKTPVPPSQPKTPAQAQSPNYQNVPTFRFDGKVGDGDDDDDHDYENNPVARKKYEDEQKRKRAVDNNKGYAHSNTLQFGSVGLSPCDRKTHSGIHPTSQSTKLSSPSMSSKDLKAPSNAAGHTAGRKEYINLSKSLENLDKRTVPQPPALPTNPVIKVPSIERHCSPPKPHLGKSSGYINQPA